jgi:hypothetical protein
MEKALELILNDKDLENLISSRFRDEAVVQVLRVPDCHRYPIHQHHNTPYEGIHIRYRPEIQFFRQKIYLPE